MGSKRVYFVSGYRIGAVNPSSANHWHAGHVSLFSPTGSCHFVLKNAVYGLEQTISSLGVHCVNIIKLKKFLRQSAVCIAGVIVNFHLGQRDHLESGFIFVDGKLSLRKLPSTCAESRHLCQYDEAFVAIFPFLNILRPGISRELENFLFLASIAAQSDYTSPLKVE